MNASDETVRMSSAMRSVFTVATAVPLVVWTDGVHAAIEISGTMLKAYLMRSLFPDGVEAELRAGKMLTAC